MFPSETAQSMYDFRANDVVGKIAPRPLLLLHSSDDHVTPVDQSVALFAHAGQPTELHLFADTDHFMFAEGNTRVHHVVANWLGHLAAPSPTAPEILEFTPQNTIVWQWGNQTLARQITNVFIIR
jgi:hypothetical protein